MAARTHPAPIVPKSENKPSIFDKYLNVSLNFSIQNSVLIAEVGYL